MKLFYRIFSLVLLASVAACANKEPRLPKAWQSPGDGPSILTETYHISVGDQLAVNVWKNPELSISEPVRPDGKITVPLIGEIMAAGKSPSELADVIESRLSVFIKNPNVTVILTGLQGQAYLSRIRVIGAVGRDISINYSPGMTVLDAVLDAGSIDDFADANNTKLHRLTKSGRETYDIRLEDIMEDGDLTTNVPLQPGDIITVPESLF